MTEHLFFYLGLCFIFVHEMDAIRCKEWRIFPGLSYLNDQQGYMMFTVAHIPLYLFIFWGLTGQARMQSFMFWLDLFFIVHIILHLSARNHPQNLFEGWLSWSLIWGAGICGLIDLTLTVFQNYLMFD